MTPDTGRLSLSSSAPYVLFGTVWLAAMVFLAVRGTWVWVGRGAGLAAGLGLFVALTYRLTRDGPDREEAGESRDRGSAIRLGIQLAVALAFAVLVILRGSRLPVWGSVMNVLIALGRAVSPTSPNYVVHPILFAVLPVALVLALGANWKGIGFGRGWRAWRVIGVWSAPAVAVWVYRMAAGQLGPARIGHALLVNTFHNGFGEEVLWRGLVQTRIARLWTPGWGLVLTSLAFGWWHIYSIHAWAGNDILLAAALNVVVQGTIGLAYGIIFDRTRNLLAPSVVHVLINSVAI